MELPPRFVDEQLALHWQVDDSSESFTRLCQHLEKTTNFRDYFDKAIASVDLPQTEEGLIIADIGAGIGWTSALLALRPEVAKVFIVEPSTSRQDRVMATLRHYGAAEDKIQWISGSYESFQLPQKADLILLCGSLHHCYDQDIPKLFENIRNALSQKIQGGTVLVANEHYVTPLWVFHRMLSFLKHFSRRSELFYGPGRWRAPYPRDGEHWRNRQELETMFSKEGFNSKFFMQDGDLCKKNSSWISRLEWKYYHALLTIK
jgi:SAM-dependent methyltransferase